MTSANMTFPPDSAREPEVPRELGKALDEVCAAAGLDPRGAKLLRFVNNGVFLLRTAPVVVRVVLTSSLAYRADNVVEAARWLTERGMPSVRLLPGLRQPVRAGGYVATVWEEVPDTGTPPTGYDLGTLLRSLHALEIPPSVGEWQPVADARRRLAEGEHELDPRDRDFLKRHCDSVERRLEELEFALPRGTVHGDAHLGNVIIGPEGPVLCDFDSLCAGPPEWDLTPMAVGYLRLGRSPEAYRQLVAAYGFDVVAWEGFPVLRDLRELKITVSVLPVLGSNPSLAGELRKRLRSMRERDFTVRWTPYR
ncbi:aminoglycoside phosphotransferase [Actinopolyspora mortivallis]|uniref:Aminoglycoside phosphotransferase n=2 Tax=Actinopolyspora mortivallis TaxID=33906 RepID=A0A2T0GSL8_ACTMO|nr:aminoglycoside phosphotransferase [Actinopolyspora mortivallis]